MVQATSRWVLVALVVTSTVTLAEDWPNWRGPRYDGSWNAPSLSDKWPAEGPTIAWRVSLGAGYSGCTSSEGLVYTMDRPFPSEKDKQPDGQERVVCFDGITGRSVWSHEYPAHYGKLDYGSGPRASVTIHGGRAYSLGAVGQACCLDAKNGTVVWQRDLREDAKATIPEWGLSASPLIVDDLVILHAGLPGGSVVALDKATGKERWRSLDDPVGYATPLLVSHHGARQLIVWTPMNVCSIDPAIGRLFWKTPYPVTYGVSIATPIYHDGIVFVSGYWEGAKGIRLGGAPEKMELAYEENRWLRGLMCPPLVRDGVGYLLDKKHGLVAFEIATGRKLWDDGGKLTPEGRNPQMSIAWTGNSRQIIALNSEGELILGRLEETGYEEDARAKILGPTWAHPAFSGDSVYARSDAELVRVIVNAGAQ